MFKSAAALFWLIRVCLRLFLIYIILHLLWFLRALFVIPIGLAIATFVLATLFIPLAFLWAAWSRSKSKYDDYMRAYRTWFAIFEASFWVRAWGVFLRYSDRLKAWVFERDRNKV